MAGSGDMTPDGDIGNIRDFSAARQRRKNVGKNAVRYHRDSDQPRKTSAKIIRLFPEEEPDFSEAELMELEDALNALDEVSGHRYNVIQNWLMKLGEAQGDRVERIATVRIADFMKSNPRASLSDIHEVIFEPPF